MRNVKNEKPERIYHNKKWSIYLNTDLIRDIKISAAYDRKNVNEWIENILKEHLGSIDKDYFNQAIIEEKYPLPVVNQGEHWYIYINTLIKKEIKTASKKSPIRRLNNFLNYILGDYIIKNGYIKRISEI